ncbi:MAG: FHA domain-containing protein, partial [Actinomycetota bacterium]|nr:FHA domain-containing protein [Actinomycetota bacterium]
MSRYVIAIVAGPAAQREVDIDAELEVGREPQNGLNLEGDDQVSRRHARLTLAGDGLLVTDLD